MIRKAFVTFVFIALSIVAAHAASVNVRIGGSIEIDNELTGPLLSLAGTTDIGGRIHGSANIASGHINISGTVQEDVTAASGVFTLLPQGQIGGDLRLASGDAEISGAVGGDLIVAAGSVTVSGQIGGDVKAFAGKVIVEPGAVIGGRIITRGPGTVDISPDARVFGGESSEPPQLPHPHPGHVFPPLIVSTLMFALLQFPLIGLGTLFFGLLFLALFPQFAESVAQTLRHRPGPSVLAGFLTLLMVPVAVVFLMITILGLPVAILMIFAFALILVMSYGIGAVVLTSAALHCFRVEAVSGLSLPAGFWWRALYLVVGLVVLRFLRLLPVAGSFVVWITIMLGLGALTIELWRRWRRE